MAVVARPRSESSDARGDLAKKLRSSKRICSTPISDDAALEMVGPVIVGKCGRALAKFDEPKSAPAEFRVFALTRFSATDLVRAHPSNGSRFQRYVKTRHVWCLCLRPDVFVGGGCARYRVNYSLVPKRESHRCRV